MLVNITKNMGDIYSTKVLYIKLKSKKVLDENKTFVA